MLFNSKPFILGFLPLVYAGYLAAAVCGGKAAPKLWLLCASLFFYARWNPPFAILLIASILFNYAIGLKLRAAQVKRRWLILGLSFNLGLLAFFKYMNFLVALCGVKLQSGGIILPLGISFFTFQQVMFLVDTYREDFIPASFLNYACFIAFFPHLIAGPIVRPRNIIPQFAALAPLQDRAARLADGLEIFLLGLAKKLVMADGLAHFADPGFAAAARHDPVSLIEAWVALMAYGLQIYFDFSGYSDMAIGLARIFGIHFPRNFNSPYKARNISEFWQRWNITLSGFLRDYLYIPLGGNRHGEPRRIFNLMLTMLLGGLWHGAALRFILWGGLHGCYLVIHGWFRRLGFRLPAAAAQFITIMAVLLAWVPFRAPSYAAALCFYRGLFGFNGLALPQIAVKALPWLSRIGHQVQVLPYLGDARTLSLPQGILFLCAGWFIVLRLPEVYSLTKTGRSFAIVSSFAFTVQALFFAPFTIPFLYFQF